MKRVPDVRWKDYKMNKDPRIALLVTELEYYRLGPALGIIMIDNVDKDFSLVVLRKDKLRKQWRAVDLSTNNPTIEMAREVLEGKLKKNLGQETKLEDVPTILDAFPEAVQMMGDIAESWHRERVARCKKKGE